MTPDPTELARVLNDLETRRTLPVNVEVQKLGAAARDAARLLREIAADFDEYAEHGLDDRGNNCDWLPPGAKGDCSCGLDAARAKWRLEP